MCICPCVTPEIACACSAGGLEEREDQCCPLLLVFSVKMLVLRWTLKWREALWQPAPFFAAFTPCLLALTAHPGEGLHLSRVLSSLVLGVGTPGTSRALSAALVPGPWSVTC